MKIPAAETVELLLDDKLNAIEAGKPLRGRMLRRHHSVHELGEGRSEVVAQRVDIVRRGVGLLRRREQEGFDARRIGSPKFDATRPRLPHQHEAIQFAVRTLVGKRRLQFLRRPIGNNAIRALRGPPMRVAFKKVGLPGHSHELGDIARLKMIGQPIGLRIGPRRMRDRGHFNSGIERPTGAGIERGAGQDSG